MERKSLATFRQEIAYQFERQRRGLYGIGGNLKTLVGPMKKSGKQKRGVPRGKKGDKVVWIRTEKGTQEE